MKVEKALDDYYFEHARKTAADPQNIEISIRHLKAYFKGEDVAALGIPHSRGYLASRIAAGAQASTVGRELTVLRAAANHAVNWKRITAAEMPSFEMPKIAKSKGIWLFEDELSNLTISASTLHDNGRTKAFIDIAYFTASRRTAVETLRWSQVNLAGDRINLSAPGEDQTTKRRPIVPIDPKLKPTLLHCREAWVGSPFVLGDDGRMDHWFRKAAEKIGLGKLPERDGRPAATLTPHMLRHSRATHLLAAGKDPWQVAGLLGDNVQTVIDVYGHHCPGYMGGLFNDLTA